MSIEAGPRSCGGCTACCTVMAVSSIGKPAGTPCVHECAEGCAIYERRPEQCRSDFFCLWMRDQKDLLRDSDRPDRIGIVFTDGDDGTGGRLALVAREVTPGAAQGARASELIGHLRGFVPVTVREARPASVTLTRDGTAMPNVGRQQ